MILGSSLISVILLLRTKHPKAERPMIDYDSGLLFLPIILAGATLGVFLNILFPGWLVTAFMFVIMGATAIRTCTKARSQWKKESKNMQVVKVQIKEESASLTKHDAQQGNEKEMHDIENNDHDRHIEPPIQQDEPEHFEITLHKQGDIIEQNPSQMEEQLKATTHDTEQQQEQVEHEEAKGKWTWDCGVSFP